MLSLLPRLPAYMAFRRYGNPKPFPFNLVVSVTYRCNSRCKTCNVWRRSAEELTTDEWERVFANEKPDKVIHLAAMAGVRNSVQFPLLYEEVNVRGTLHLHFNLLLRQIGVQAAQKRCL